MITKLLDNRWAILLMKQVDGQYVAAAKKNGEKWSDIFEVVDEAGLPIAFDQYHAGCGPRRLDRKGVGATPEEAMQRCVDAVLGLATVKR